MRRAEQLITDNLELWSSAVKAKSSAGRSSNKKLELYGISKLRELILELAVRGLLTPQKQTDDPTQSLLKNIADKKQALILSKACKKPANLPSISEKEKAFLLPSGWEWARLQDICEYIQRGKGPRYSNSGSVRVISQKCVQWKGFNPDSARHIDDSSLAKYKRERFLKPNDLLWNSTGTGTVGRINRINQIKEGMFVADSHVTVVRTLLDDSSYICTYLASAGIQCRFDPEDKSPLVSGSTNQVELNTKDILSLPIPVPPLAEQHRIVAKVDELMAICDQLEEEQENNLEIHETLVSTLLGALTSAATDASHFADARQRIQDNFDILFKTESSIDQLKQTILQLAVMGKLVPQDLEKEQVLDLVVDKIHTSGPEATTPFELPPSWLWSHLNQLADINGGFAFKSGNYNNNGTRVVRISDFDEYGFKSGKIVRHEFSAELEKFRLIEGDILMAMTGGTVGKSFHVKSLDEPMIVNQRVATIRASKAIVSHFLHIVIQSKGVQEEINKAKNSTNDNISMKQIKSFLVPVPPLAEQHRIINKVDELMGLCDQLKASLHSAQDTQLKLADSIVEQAIQSPA